VDEDQVYRKSLEELVTVRTEQLRDALSVSYELLKCLKEVQSMQSLDQVKHAVQATINKFEGKIVADPPKFDVGPKRS
jgi:hypothetical protein